MGTVAVDPNRLARAKDGYATRRVPRERLSFLIDGDRAPRPGDLLLARVEEIGQHDGVERPSGRRSTIFPGDEVLVCYGNRYAPDQFEAEVPPDLGPCHLVAAGGLAARVLSSHGRMGTPTALAPIGLLGDDDGRPANVADWALSPVAMVGSPPRTIVVVGTSMNAGKTTTVANLIRGLVTSGRRVGAAKVTGTGAGKDLWLMRDAGADPVYDFTDAGLAATYLASAGEVAGVVETLTSRLAAAGVDTVVFELADGLYQRETAALLSAPGIATAVDCVLFAAGDAMGAAAGVGWLRDRGLAVCAVSGLLTNSPLAIQEASAATGLPVLTPMALRDGAGVTLLGALAAA